ncbi:hypothetical protein [Dyella sp. GSA-30]|uniref:hypothetical protein n=1 Tax=Dyella sp. GSA-30 TaxID=2994496 RepID=UPI0024926AEB|nr:hypothetical protein [Dyella sp. GSA-30]BDU19968.1 hypothetical protein DYGSA30_14250 [Dyella sp. GSA-30]
MELLFHVLTTILIAVVSATFSAWITVRLSREKFRSEHWWEKKFEAYERVIDAFHSSKKFYSEHLRASYLDFDLDDGRVEELKNQSLKARDEILRTSDIGGFILSASALSILAKYEAESENMPRQDSWQEHLDLSWSIANRYMKEFIAEAHSDLKKNK